DLAKATGAVQAELIRFASEQMDDDSQMHLMLREGMLNVEGRLRDDPTFLDGLSGALKESDVLASLLERILTSLRDEALARVDTDHSLWLDLAMQQADAWLARLTEDAALRQRVNRWCRDFAVAQLEQHHAIIGVLVEEQMNRLSDDALTQLIQKRVGEDLNW